jgi:hypothetical protein
MAAGEVAPVGGREPCPCGSGRRYKACHGSARRTPPVTRPFAGLAGECDWVALREIVPSATAPLTLAEQVLSDRPELAERSVTLGTVLPMSWPALVRLDGEIVLSLQAAPRGGDASRRLGGALLAAFEAEPGEPVDMPAGDAGPRLQDLLAGAGLTVTVHERFDWWTGGSELGDEAKQQLDRANDNVVPTARLESVEAAYWCRIGQRCHLRWAMPEGEDELLDALARLGASGRLSLGEQTRYAGAFRADGVLIPVWDLLAGSSAADVEEPAAALRARLDAALAAGSALSAEQRRVRAGLVGRQLTLR